VDAAQDRVLAGEDLHRHERIHALALEDLLGPGEVDVGRIALEDLARRARPAEAGQVLIERLRGRHRCSISIRPTSNSARASRPRLTRRPRPRSAAPLQSAAAAAADVIADCSLPASNDALDASSSARGSEPMSPTL